MQKVATVNSALRSGIQASGFAFHTFRYAGPNIDYVLPKKT